VSTNRSLMTVSISGCVCCTIYDCCKNIVYKAPQPCYLLCCPVIPPQNSYKFVPKRTFLNLECPKRTTPCNGRFPNYENIHFNIYRHDLLIPLICDEPITTNPCHPKSFRVDVRSNPQEQFNRQINTRVRKPRYRRQCPRI